MSYVVTTSLHLHKQNAPILSQVLIHFKPTPFWSNGFYFAFCILAGVASIIFPMETRGRVLKDVLTPKVNKNSDD